jgi:hypothetical protein
MRKLAAILGVCSILRTDKYVEYFFQSKGMELDKMAIQDAAKRG